MDFIRSGRQGSSGRRIIFSFWILVVNIFHDGFLTAGFSFKQETSRTSYIFIENFINFQKKKTLRSGRAVVKL